MEFVPIIPAGGQDNKTREVQTMTRTADYDPQRLAEFLEALLKERNESYREASLRAGLDHGAIRRYIRRGQRPARTSLLALADHFGVNPNDLLVLAGYLPMEIFERLALDPQTMPSDILPLVEDLRCIADPVLRRRLVEAVRVLLTGYLRDEASSTPLSNKGTCPGGDG